MVEAKNPPVRNGFNLLQVNETQLRTRYDQFRSFQKETVGQRRESDVADGVVPFERNVGVGRCLPQNGCRVVMLPPFSRQCDYDRTNMPLRAPRWDSIPSPTPTAHSAVRRVMRLDHCRSHSYSSLN